MDNKLKYLQFNNRHELKLNSLDVVSLYTNTPLQLAIKYLNINFQIINTSISKKNLISMISFIFNNSVFTFNKQICKIIYECPMGSSLSPIIADLALLQLEKDIFAKLDFVIPQPVRYLDEILLLIPENKLTFIL